MARTAAPGCASSRGRPPISPTSTGSRRPTSSGPPTPPPRRSPATGASRRRSPPTSRVVAQEIETDPATVPPERKAELLRACDERARGAGAEVTQAQAGYSEARRRITVANSDGRFAADDRTRVRLGVQVVAARDGTVETGFETLGGHRGFELVEGGAGEAIAERAARAALTLLDASPAPAGAMPVVVGNGFGGVLFHEMTGHGLEADHIQKGASVYVGKLGKDIAPAFLRAYDDGRLPGEWGTEGIDDEGTPTQATAVIHEGRVTAYLYDLLRARKDNVSSTGNGRRQSFRHLPIPRMTNTFIAPGDATPEELIAEVERGFYAVSFAGGQVDPTTGDFVFGVSEGYLIEGGEVTSPCRGATLIGNCLTRCARSTGSPATSRSRPASAARRASPCPPASARATCGSREMTVGGTAV